MTKAADKLWCFRFWILHIVIQVAVVTAREDEDYSDCQHNLVSDLLDPDVYDTSMRPVTSVNESALVMISSSLSQISDLDEHKQVLHITMWFTFAWYDPHFVWNPSQYCGISSLRADNWRVWKPDLVLYNSISEENMGTNVFADTHLRMEADGLVQWPTLAIISATCRINIHDFPFDEQSCPITLGSWTQNISMLDLDTESSDVNLQSYVENGEWDIIRFPVETVYESYSSGVFAHVIYTLEMSRRPLFYLFNILLPMLLLLTVGILAFCLSPDTGQKIQLSTTVLLTMMLFMMMLSDKLPPTSDNIPLLTQFFAVSIVLLVLSISSAVMVLALFHNVALGKDVPAWLSRVVADYLGVWMCAAKTVRETLAPAGEETTLTATEATGPASQNEAPVDPIFDGQWNTVKEEGPDVVKTPEKITNREPRTASDEVAAPAELIGRVRHVCDVYLATTRIKEIAHAQRTRWHCVITVLDRFLMIVFTFGAVLAALIIFLIALG